MAVESLLTQVAPLKSTDLLIALCLFGHCIVNEFFQDHQKLISIKYRAVMRRAVVMGIHTQLPCKLGCGTFSFVVTNPKCSLFCKCSRIKQDLTKNPRNRKFTVRLVKSGVKESEPQNLPLYFRLFSYLPGFSCVTDIAQEASGFLT